MLKDLDYWTTDHCAAYMGCSVKHFREEIAPQVGFPQALRLFNSRRLYWKAANVRAWFERNLAPADARHSSGRIPADA